MKKIIKVLAVPSALFLGIVIGLTFKSASTAYWQDEAEYWHDMSFRIARNAEDSSFLLHQRGNVCLDVVGGELTYQEGIDQMNQIGDQMELVNQEFEAISTELDPKE